MTKPDGALLTKHGVAEMLGVSVRTVQNLKLPRVLLPGRGDREIVRYDPAEVRAYIESRKTSRVARLSRAS